MGQRLHRGGESHQGYLVVCLRHDGPRLAIACPLPVFIRNDIVCGGGFGGIGLSDCDTRRTNGQPVVGDCNIRG